mmetsp:Transcript_68320/g.176138  ORF Transcript_68320/g.176138 Transcript_68320/m.176138 type:complete len:399 (-) Transcript_68320:975-2171(-)
MRDVRGVREIVVRVPQVALTQVADEGPQPLDVDVVLREAVAARVVHEDPSCNVLLLDLAVVQHVEPPRGQGLEGDPDLLELPLHGNRDLRALAAIGGARPLDLGCGLRSSVGCERQDSLLLCLQANQSRLVEGNAFLALELDQRSDLLHQALHDGDLALHHVLCEVVVISLVLALHALHGGDRREDGPGRHLDADEHTLKRSHRQLGGGVIQNEARPAHQDNDERDEADADVGLRPLRHAVVDVQRDHAGDDMQLEGAAPGLREGRALQRVAAVQAAARAVDAHLIRPVVLGAVEHSQLIQGFHEHRDFVLSAASIGHLPRPPRDRINPHLQAEVPFGVEPEVEDRHRHDKEDRHASHPLRQDVGKQVRDLLQLVRLIGRLAAGDAHAGQDAHELHQP